MRFRRPSPRPAALTATAAFLVASLAQAQTAALPATAASAASAASAPRSGASAPRSERHRPPGQQQTSKPTPKPDAKLARVEVDGQASADAQRRASTASKIIIDRDELDRFGDQTIGETLKRLPGVTTGGRPGRGGEIRMRGMGSGYTQILIDGERVPPGFSIDQLQPDQVERIEVYRAPTAEHGARAIAGTINIVLREALQKHINNLHLAMAEERDRYRPNVSWTRNDKLDDKGGAYTFTLSATRNDRVDDIHTWATTEDLATQQSSTQATLGQSRATSQSVSMNGKVQLKVGADDLLSLQPFVVANKSWNTAESDQEPGISYNLLDTVGGSHSGLGRLRGTWTHKFDPLTKLELFANLGVNESDSQTLRNEYWDGQAVPTLVETDTTHVNDRSWSWTGKLSHQMQPHDQSLMAGLEAEGVDRTQTHNCTGSDNACLSVIDFGDVYAASTLRTAAYVQDEWNPSPHWSTYAGLRWEGIDTNSTSATYNVHNMSSVWTPLLHAVWRPEEDSKNQVRMSLTRSYRPPTLQNLISQPNINFQYPTGSNTPNYPDQSGNPNLKPELATGFELAYENYLSKGGLLSANIFTRNINNLMRTVTSLQTVSWSDGPRWVAQPENIGNAKTQGIELEAKFSLNEYFPTAAPVSIRSNLALFHSTVEGIQGPNNKIDQQPRGTANFGGDYRLRSAPLTLGGNLSYTPSYTVQETTITAASTTKKRVFDFYGLWNFNANTALRLSANNLDPLNYGTTTAINDGEQLITTINNGRTFVLWQARLEIRL